MSFIDEIMAARSAAHRDEVAVARRVAASFDRATLRLRERVKELRNMERLGMFRSATDARRQAEAVLAEVQGLAEIAASESGRLISFARERTIRNVLAETTMLAEEAGQTVSLGTTFAQVPYASVREMAERPVFGLTPQRGAARIAQRLTDDVRERLVSGLASGESVKDIASDISEMADITESAATRLTRTNMAAASNDALRATYEANADVIDGYVWDATLDERVCLRCGALHGTFFPLNSTPPGPPLHPNCRCVLTPHLIDEGAPDDDEYRRTRPLLESGERSKQTELVPADKRFEAWLRDQPAGATVNVTGSELKDDLWRRSKLPFTELVKPDTSVRSDAEALQKALTLHPRDSWLRAKAQELGVSPISADTQGRKDALSASDAPFTLGSRRGLSPEAQALRERVDEAKRSRLMRNDEPGKVGRRAAREAAEVAS